MPTEMSFDELNRLSESQRVLDIDQYFDEMMLSDEQKDVRKMIAEDLEDEFWAIFSWILLTMPARNISEEELKAVIQARYEEAVGNTFDDVPKSHEHIEEMSREIARSTMRHIEDPYFLSQDRAKYIGENESNTLWNMSEYEDALRRGMRYKQWNTIIDEVTRETHVEADGQEVEIDMPFEVGGFYMDYPKDPSYGAPPDEIVNCRCSVTYF